MYKFSNEIDNHRNNKELKTEESELERSEFSDYSPPVGDNTRQCRNNENVYD